LHNHIHEQGEILKKAIILYIAKSKIDLPFHSANTTHYGLQGDKAHYNKIYDKTA
jgi:hypothetical protein